MYAGGREDRVESTNLESLEIDRMGTDRPLRCFYNVFVCRDDLFYSSVWNKHMRKDYSMRNSGFSMKDWREERIAWLFVSSSFSALNEKL